MCPHPRSWKRSARSHGRNDWILVVPGPRPERQKKRTKEKKKKKNRMIIHIYPTHLYHVGIDTLYLHCNLESRHQKMWHPPHLESSTKSSWHSQSHGCACHLGFVVTGPRPEKNHPSSIIQGVVDYSYTIYPHSCTFYIISYTLFSSLLYTHFLYFR